MLPHNPNTDTQFDEASLRTICLAGGCFWGTEAYMARIPGVARTSCGYANGQTVNPTYKEVCTGETGHAEAIMLHYDPGKIALDRLLTAFFETIDPTTLNRQGPDVGTQYRTGIHCTETQDTAAVASFVEERQAGYDEPIVTEVLPLESFYPAEEYHQRYLEKNPGGYCHVDLGKLSN
ncbi:MAG: peptide-methionine (S)-S-oxide reductase MsrA [Defluviitaleaceae bacterium]|nr:peptide-methionine (S)-S-oxide reductase MsrA [Defluviitaleaceae bacterium]